MRDLRRRSDGRRESGAFLLGTRNGKSNKIRSYICYDDLVPNALDSGVVTMTARGFATLWPECKRRGQAVLADIHAHPGPWVGQSHSDQHNPMIGKCGHLALIVPSYAQPWCWGFKGAGIYEYEGDYKWRDIQTDNRKERIHLVLF